MDIEQLLPIIKNADIIYIIAVHGDNASATLLSEMPEDIARTKMNAAIQALNSQTPVEWN